MGVRISTGGRGPQVTCPACGNPVRELPRDASEEELNQLVREAMEDHVRACLPTRRMVLRLRRRRR